MTDLISRQAAIDALKNVLVSEELEYAIPALEKLPSADAVPVVRCKDCKYGEKEDRLYYCNYTGETWNYGNFYCAGGERKDDE